MIHSLEAIQHRIGLDDEQALADLYTLLHKKLEHFACSLVRSRELAEEIVEDVWVKLWCNRQNVHSIGNLQVYLYVAVKNQSLNMLSRRAGVPMTMPYEQLPFSQPAADPCSQLISAEQHRCMEAAIEALPPKCKMIFKLVREDGLRYKDVAAILHISVNTIDAQMAIAVKRVAAAVAVSKPVRHY